MLFILQTPAEAQRSLAEALRRNRKIRRHSRATAAELSGVPMTTIRRFEQTGKISLGQFLMLCSRYGQLSAAEALFPKPAPATMDELLRRHKP